MSVKEQATGTRGAARERTHALDRWLYRGRRPNRVARLINGALARLAATGIGPAQLVTLEVAGRRTGKTISFPVVVADYQGERYLVSMLGGETNWVRTCTRLMGVRCCGAGTVRSSSSTKSSRGGGPPSCAATSSARPGPGRISRSAAAPPWRSSTALPRSTRYSM